MFGRIRKLESETNFFASFLASTCAVTVGLNLSWPSADYASAGPQPLQQHQDQRLPVPDHQQQQQQQQQQDECAAKGRPGGGGGGGGRTALYAAAVLWAQWSGSFVRAVGPYNLMACGVCASACAGLVLAAVDPRHAVSTYGAPALQGFGCASLAVAVPNYVAANAGRPSRGVILCLIEVFTLVGALIAHVLSVLATPDQMNIWSTAVMLLNVLALLVIRVTTKATGKKKYSRMFGSAIFSCNDMEDEPLVSEQKKYEWVSDFKRYLFTENTHRKNILVALTLFAFRDFSGVYVFEKIILHVYNLLNSGPVSYRPCAFLMTTLQLMFTIPAVVAIGFCGERKLLLISSFGMHLSMTVLGMIIWNSSHAFTSGVSENNMFYLAGIAIVLLLYVAFYSQGLGSIPWALQFQIIDQKIRDIATGLIISAHFLFLMITEVSYMNDQYSEHSVVVYWFIFVCFLQIIFVYYFVLK